MQENPFWQYSLAVYSQGGVEPILLSLQDDYAADVNVILCCCWLAQQSVELTTDNIVALVDMGIEWRAECIEPLRSVRRFLKDYEASADIYQSVKALELEVEFQHQCMLFNEIKSHSWPLSSLDRPALICKNLQNYFNDVLKSSSKKQNDLLKKLTTILEASL